jgi:hypothetical protein
MIYNQSSPYNISTSTTTDPFGGNLAAIIANSVFNRNAYASPVTSTMSSQIPYGTNRAQQAYQVALSGINTNPAYNQSAMFSGLSNPMMGSFGQPSQGMYGAGRFTGGLLGSPSFNFSAPSATK